MELKNSWGFSTNYTNSSHAVSLNTKGQLKSLFTYKMGNAKF